jgi:hypothetical protein
MFGLLYYKYIKYTKGVVFNGEVSNAKLIAALEAIVYLFALLIFLLSHAH